MYLDIEYLISRREHEARSTYCGASGSQLDRLQTSGGQSEIHDFFSLGRSHTVVQFLRHHHDQAHFHLSLTRHRRYPAPVREVKPILQIDMPNQSRKCYQIQGFPDFRGLTLSKKWLSRPRVPVHLLVLLLSPLPTLLAQKFYLLAKRSWLAFHDNSTSASGFLTYPSYIKLRRPRFSSLFDLVEKTSLFSLLGLGKPNPTPDT